MKFLLICVLSLTAQAAEPVTSAWIMSRPAASAELRKVLPEVHEVNVQDQFVEVRSAGLSLFNLGPFQNPLTGGGGVRDLRFRIPRKPVLQEGALLNDTSQLAGPGAMGVFLNGVPLYNRFAEASYLGRNMWHFDLMTFTDPAHPISLGILEPMMANSSAHSPILGFALDGFPIYGPWAFVNPDGSGGLRRMRSGYRLRNIQERTKWPDGTQLTPSQYGPPAGDTFPLGSFVEDYEYKADPGDLDSSNGRFSVTPEYPQGTYVYFLTTTELNKVAFPYFVADRFRGKLPGIAAQGRAPAAGVQFTHGTLEAGRPVELRFAFPGTRSLEIVHEKPLHLMAVSSDLDVFDHIHPEWKPGGVYAVTHTFPRPGKYRLFAQFTLPGEPEHLQTFDVVVTGEASTAQPSKGPPPIVAKLRQPAHIRTGEDVPFTVTLSGEPVEPYLGAWGHFVFLDQGMGAFIHAHPEGAASVAPDPTTPHIHGVSDVASGPPPPSVSFTANFSKPGRYKLWAQFQVAGQPVVIPYLVDVAGAAPVSRAPSRVPTGAIPVMVDERGFTPARIEASSTTAATLAITRAATPNCGSQIVFPSLGIKRDLPIGKTTLVELPRLTEDLAFTCGMGMYRGLIVGVTQPRNRNPKPPSR